MFREGDKVKVISGTYKGKRGVVTKRGCDGAWYSIRTNKGINLHLVPFNVLEGR